MALAPEGNMPRAKSAVKKTSFYLNSHDREDGKSEDGRSSASKFKFVARKIIMVNRAFLPAQRKISRISSGTQSETESSRCSGKESGPRENTYKMEPDSKFLPQETRKIMETILRNYLEGEEYSTGECKKLCMLLSDKIKAAVRGNALLDRHKLVCVVHIGQVLGQGVHSTSRCLWNPKFDAFASATFQNDNLFAQASIFAVYME